MAMSGEDWAPGKHSPDKMVAWWEFWGSKMSGASGGDTTLILLLVPFVAPAGGTLYCTLSASTRF